MKKNDSALQNFFWRKNKKLKKIKILNPGDFHYPYEAMGNDDLGLADTNEITQRNAIMNFLFNRPKLREKIKTWLSTCRNHSTLPKGENDFMAFYEKENPYWQMTFEIVEELAKEKKLPERLEVFLTQLKKSLPLAGKEIQMAKRIVDQLKKTTIMEGLIEMSMKGDINDYEKSAIIGQKAFNSAWSPNYVASIPRFLKKFFFRLLKITWLVQIIANILAKNKARKSAVIEHIPRSLISDIEKSLKSLLTTPTNLEERAERMKIPQNTFEFIAKEKERLKHQLHYMELEGVSCAFKFKYNSEGLRVTPLYLRYPSSNDIDFNYHDYEATSSKDRAKLKKLQISFTERMRIAHSLTLEQSRLKMLENETKFEIGKTYFFDSPQTDRNFRWLYLSNLYVSKENEETYYQITNNREFLLHRLAELARLSNKLDEMIDQAAEKGLPICMPKLQESGTGVNFRNLAPIDMFNQKKEMVPFSFPRINGHLVCLTGRHGGGKSVSGNSVLQALWLAQSGYPVFAESFEFDIKDVIGSVTNDKGEGSTATIFVNKTINLFANIEKVPVHKSLIFIDEMGKGTQESASLKIGSRILTTISKKGYSAIFNTQNMDLARFAENDLGAICLKVNKKHQFESGIGEGELEDLVRETGLEKYLMS